MLQELYALYLFKVDDDFLLLLHLLISRISYSWVEECYTAKLAVPITKSSLIEFAPVIEKDVLGP